MLCVFCSCFASAQTVVLRVEVEQEQKNSPYKLGSLWCEGKELPLKGAGLYSLTVERRGSYRLTFSDSLDSRNPYHHFMEPRNIKIRKHRKDTVVVSVRSSCYKNVQVAEEEFANEQAAFIVFGGIAPPMYIPNNPLRVKYGVSYDIFGCIVDVNKDCAAAYNRRLAQLMDEKYGEEWRNEISYRIYGLE